MGATNTGIWHFCILHAIDIDKNDIIPVKLIGKNYVGWSFHLQNFVQGQGLAGYLDGSVTAPSDEKSKATTAVTTTKDATAVTETATTKEKSAATWKQNNARW